MSRLLLVDLSYQTYRAVASHPMLTSGQTFTGGLYGFLVTLAKQIRETAATRVVVCQDLKPYLRSQVYPKYKTLRREKADEDLLRAFQQSLKLVVEALGVIGVPVFGQQGFESDDCIASFVLQLRHRYEAIYAASNDSDLYQLLWVPNFKMLRKDDLMDEAKLLQTTGLTPAEFTLAHTLMGTHNDIEGIPRVGEKTAIKAVKDPALLRKFTEQWGELIRRNKSLIRLPHPEYPRKPLPASGVFEARDLYRFCSRFDIEATKSMLDSFEQVCPDTTRTPPS